MASPSRVTSRSETPCWLGCSCWTCGSSWTAPSPGRSSSSTRRSAPTTTTGATFTSTPSRKDEIIRRVSGYRPDEMDMMKVSGHQHQGRLQVRPGGWKLAADPLLGHRARHADLHGDDRPGQGTADTGHRRDNRGSEELSTRVGRSFMPRRPIGHWRERMVR